LNFIYHFFDVYYKPSFFNNNENRNRAIFINIALFFISPSETTGATGATGATGKYIHYIYMFD
jgi:hypothetical protein